MDYEVSGFGISGSAQRKIYSVPIALDLYEKNAIVGLKKCLSQRSEYFFPGLLNLLSVCEQSPQGLLDIFVQVKTHKIV